MKFAVSSIEALRKNIKHEKEIIKETYSFLNQLSVLENLEKQGFRINKSEKKILASTINSLLSQLKILNSSIPEIIKKISFFKELPSGEGRESGRKKPPKEKLISVKYKRPVVPAVNGRTFVTIKRNDRLKFLKELSLTDTSVRRLKKEHKILEEKAEKFKKPSVYAKISNKFFSKLSSSLIKRGYFSKIGNELRKANLYFLSQTYISMAFFSSLIAFFAAIILLIILLPFNLSFSFPFLFAAEEPTALRFLKYFWIIMAAPILTFIVFYFYPLIEKKAIAGKINQELPFVVIHMSAVAGSGIEPTKIFEIIVKGKGYPDTRKEIKKLLNEINIYGYDLVTALRNSARATSSKKLSELYNGLATTITSGGSLKEFLNKRSETLIFNYRIEREKYTRMSETFMDIYISVVIAAPMIMTMLLVMINLTGISLGLSLNIITLLMILGISLINILFIIFLYLTQPEV